jgi:hypothetical protein
MFSLDILEVVIGLAFIYMILSLITTTLTEFISQIFAMRASNLRRGVQTLLYDLDNTGLARKFYEHPLIKSLGHQRTMLSALGRQSMPSYINPRTFAQTILDLLANGGKLNAEFKYFEDAQKIIEALNSSNLFDDNPQVQRQLQVILQGTKTLKEAEKAIEDWFNDMTDRISGWYKRYIQVITLLVSMIVAVTFNGDTLSLFNRLTNDPSVRTALVGAAQDAIRNDLVPAPAPEATLEPGVTPTPTTPDLAGAYTKINDLQQKINASFQLVGWVFAPVPPTVPDVTGMDDTGKQVAQNKYEAALARYRVDADAYPNNPQRLPQNPSDWISKIIGLLLTGVAVSLGAPFWFDVLKRFTTIRSSGNVSGDTSTAPPPPPTVVVVTPAKPDDDIQTGVG